MSTRKLLIALLCPLFVVAGVIIIQGCGGGSQSEEAAETSTEATETVEKSEPAMESHSEDLALAGYACPMHPTEVSLEPGKCGQCGMDLEKAKLHYTCPHCGGSKMKPGKCACGMDLVLQVTETEESGTAY